MMEFDIVELVDRVKRKDMLAMKTLYNNSAKAMMTLSYRITKDRSESEDILQESYMKSFEKISSLEEPKRYYSWLKRIVVNRSLSAVKKNRSFVGLEQVEVVESQDEEQWFERVSMNKIKAAIVELPDGCREVFTLFLMENYKHREIAEMLDISLSNSKSQYQYALKLLRKKLEKFKFN